MLGVWEEAHGAGLGALQDTDLPFSKECKAPGSRQASLRPSRRKLRHKARKRLPAATQCARARIGPGCPGSAPAVSGVPLAPNRHRPSLPIQVWGWRTRAVTQPRSGMGSPLLAHILRGALRTALHPFKHQEPFLSPFWGEGCYGMSWQPTHRVLHRDFAGGVTAGHSGTIRTAHLAARPAAQPQASGAS